MLRFASLLFACSLIGGAIAQSVTTFTVFRDDTEIVIANHALSADGARSIGNNQNCEDAVRMTIVYGPKPGRVTATINETIITSSLALTRKELEQDDRNEEAMEMLPATVTFRVPGCIEAQEVDPEGVVKVEQGRTTVYGSHFELPAAAEEGILYGPISLTRVTEEGDTQLTAESDELSVRIETQDATLYGDVTVRSDERVTTADTLVLDEDAGTATLMGNPARSVKGNDVVEGTTLLYYLDTDDIVVIGKVQAELEIE